MSSDRQFDGRIYKDFSSIPSTLLSGGYSTESYIERFMGKCEWYRKQRYQEMCVAKLAPLINLLARQRPAHVVDYGGGVGQLYFGTLPYLTEPERIAWHVVDIPETVRAARPCMANMPALTFHENLETLSGGDLVVFRQSLQVIGDYQTVIQNIALKLEPLFIQVSGVTAGENMDYVSLLLLDSERGVPCYIFNESNLIATFDRNGYQLLEKCREDIPVNLSNMPSGPYQMDSDGDNRARSYLFVHRSVRLFEMNDKPNTRQ